MMQVQDKTSVIRQKDESQNECFKKTKHVKISQKRTFLTPWYAHIRCSFVCLFFRIFNVFCFLETPILESLFCLITVENKILELVINLFSLIKCIWKISPLLRGTLIKIWICGTWFLCPLLTCVCFLARNLPL